MNKKDSLGDRMKRYEAVSRFQLTPRSAVIIRVDGRAFHTFTKHCEKPFDKGLAGTMVWAAKHTANVMQGFKLAYVQSDEVSFLLTDYDDINTQGWFGYVQSKMISVASSTFTSYFMDCNWCREDYLDEYGFLSPPTFDARAFVVPQDDIANYFLWRAKDWERNSLTMYCQSFFSHKQLMGKNKEDKHEMLHAIGKNWTTDVSDRFKNGTFLLNEEGGIVEYNNVLPHYEDISGTVESSFMKEESETVEERILRETIEDSDLAANQSPYS